MVPQISPVIGNKPRKQALRRGRHKLPREARFAGARWSADQYRFRADENRRGMDARCFRHRRGLSRRQPHHKPRAEDSGLFCATSNGDPIFDPDRSAVCLDDLFGNREAKARILSKALFRPISVKTLKNLVERFRSDARSVIVHQNLDLAFDPAAGNTDIAAWRRKRAGIVDQIANDLTEARVMARYLEI